MPTATARKNIGVESNRALVVALAVLAIAAGAALMLIGANLGILYALLAVFAVFAVIVVVVAPVLGIVVFVGTLLLGLPWFLAGDGRLTANNLLGLILFAVLIVQVCLTRDLWFLKTPQVILFALIGAVLVGSLMHSRLVYIPAVPPPKDQTENTLFIFFSRLLFLCMFVNFVRTKRHVLLILFAVLVFTMAVIPSAFNNLANYKGEEDIATGKTLDADTGKATEFRVTSDTTSWGKNENRLAFMCNVSVLLIWMFMQFWRRWWVWAMGFPLIMIMGGLTLSTASRSGFLSLGLVFMFLLFQKGISWPFRASVLGAIVFCGLIFFIALPRASYERLLNYSVDQSQHPEAWKSTQSRIETNQHAIEVFLGAPLIGIGPGNFRWLHRERYPYSLAAGRPNHNSYLWAATEGGIVTVFLYLLLFYAIWRDLRTAQRLYPQDDVLWHVTRFLRGFFFIWVFFSIFADFWLEVHLYLIAGLTMLLVQRRFEDYAEEAPAEAGAPPPLPANAGPAALLPSRTRS
jgi:O-Antigen ligase